MCEIVFIAHKKMKRTFLTTIIYIKIMWDEQAMRNSL